MSDYERDLMNYEFDSQHENPNSDIKKPYPNNYDEHGYKKGSVTYENNLILDNYLIQTYGIEYARQHPIKKL